MLANVPEMEGATGAEAAPFFGVLPLPLLASLRLCGGRLLRLGLHARLGRFRGAPAPAPGGWLLTLGALCRSRQGCFGLHLSGKVWRMSINI